MNRDVELVASSAHERRTSSVQVYGACGATAGVIKRWPFHAVMNSRARPSESSKLAASGAGN